MKSGIKIYDFTFLTGENQKRTAMPKTKPHSKYILAYVRNEL